MVINGQELSASKLDSDKERFTVYESQFQKFKQKTTKGTLIDLSSEKTPIIIINFWASWCRPCISEFKGMNALMSKFPNRVKVIGINNDVEDALKEIKKIEKKYKLSFESIENESGTLAEAFNVTRIPATIVYFKGKVIEFSNTEYDFMNEKFVDKIKSNLEKIKKF
jgi:thiol-disulfide isomerase/thioredoxin